MHGPSITTVLAAEPVSTPVPEMLAPILAVVGVLLLGMILVVSIRQKVARRQAATPSPRERIERIREDAGAHDDVHARRAELLDLAQRLASQLDVKAERLEQLIAQADERLARLDRRQPVAPVEEPPPAPEAAPASEPAPDPLSSAVYELADRGHGPVDIAQQLDEQIGKVELILALRGPAG